jgi:hypothetical protein
MPFQIHDLVKETSESTGTGALALDGAVEGFFAFGAKLADGDTTIVAIRNQAVPTEFEVAVVEYTAAGDTLTRTQVLASSNGGAAVDFSAGVKVVALTGSAEDVLSARKGHALGSDAHLADTLEGLNAKISDATLDDAASPRPPTSHGNAAHDPNFATESALADHVATIGHHADVDPTGAAEHDSWRRNNSGIYVRLPRATQAEAEAGTAENRWMDPLRTAQAIAALGGGGGSGWELVHESAFGSDTNEYEVTGLSLSGGTSGLIVIEFKIFKVGASSSGSYDLRVQFKRGSSLENANRFVTRKRAVDAISEAAHASVVSGSSAPWNLCEVIKNTPGSPVSGRIEIAQQGHDMVICHAKVQSVHKDDPAAGGAVYDSRAQVTNFSNGRVDGFRFTTSDSSAFMSASSVVRVREFSGVS